MLVNFPYMEHMGNGPQAILTNLGWTTKYNKKTTPQLESRCPFGLAGLLQGTTSGLGTSLTRVIPPNNINHIKQPSIELINVFWIHKLPSGTHELFLAESAGFYPSYVVVLWFRPFSLKGYTVLHLHLLTPWFWSVKSPIRAWFTIVRFFLKNEHPYYVPNYGHYLYFQYSLFWFQGSKIQNSGI